jgi:DNA-binding NtrC family response regulator
MNAANYTILLVDDESMITNALGRILRAESYRVVAVQNPLEAIAILSKQPIDILLSDIEMPGISGLDLVNLVRREFPRVLRILLTARNTTQSMLRAINEGQVFRYLQKPIEREKLLEIINDAREHLLAQRQNEALVQQQQQQERIKADLEEEYPGLHAVTLEDGVYLLHPELLLAKAQQFEHPFGIFIGAEKEI